MAANQSKRSTQSSKPMVVRGARSVALVGDVVNFLARGEETGGAYCLFELTCRPGGGPPLHRHTREDETFYVMEGRFVFTLEGREYIAEPGAFVHSPRGSTHCYRNIGEGNGRMLVSTLPAGFEKFVDEVAGPVDDAVGPRAPTDAEVQHVLKTAPKYGIEVVSNP